MSDSANVPKNTALQRELGVVGATVMGLGSIVGTGVFVGLGLAAQLTGPSVVLAVVVGGLVATFNALSSAQLAANHPVSGGAYEYGYRRLRPWLGAVGGWMFLAAKSASAATAALGFARYTLDWCGLDYATFGRPVAVVCVLLMTWLVSGGIRKSNFWNITIVCFTFATLLVFVIAGLPAATSAGGRPWTPFFAPSVESNLPGFEFLTASAMMFVAYTGYGRIATMAEEVRSPRVTIPRAIVTALLSTMFLYGTVAVVFVAASKVAEDPTDSALTLADVAHRLNIPIVAECVSVGAITAMLAVQLNLVLGLSRMVLAMARREDLPVMFSRVEEKTKSPQAATWLVGVTIATLTLIGDMKTTWSFSAFTVLIYYGITNLAALQLQKSERLFPAVIPWLGLTACFALAFCVPVNIWLTGLAILFAGMVIHWIRQRGRQLN
ncbi:MAG: amino acid permease [Planctomycetaceae bacterium]|nr:amino acid permease [Planctomycetaceae bacterium]MCB9952560.1 amino acid permease [Planctomycetaceae bacterium]